MPRAGFYNDNEYREYPFVFKKTYTGAALPSALIVDCGFIMGIDSGFDADVHAVYLYKIQKTASELLFEFKTTAPKLADYSITFSQSADSDEWAELRAESAPLSAGTFCASEAAWSGFIVTSRLKEFAEEMLDNQEIFYPTAARSVEPARIQSLVKTYLRSVNVGNYARRTISMCGEIDTGDYNLDGNNDFSDVIDLIAGGGQRKLIKNAECVKGAIFVEAGFNCVIGQSNTANSITIGAGLGANILGPAAADLCQNGSEIKLYENEPAALGSQFLSGGPACDEVITAINGLPAPDVKIVGGRGIRVIADPENDNTIKITRVENLLSPTC
jgi:hypothetical protein